MAVEERAIAGLVDEVVLDGWGGREVHGACEDDTLLAGSGAGRAGERRRVLSGGGSGAGEAGRRAGERGRR
jgi:hypothetical protein